MADLLADYHAAMQRLAEAPGLGVEQLGWRPVSTRSLRNAAAAAPTCKRLSAGDAEQFVAAAGIEGDEVLSQIDGAS